MINQEKTHGENVEYGEKFYTNRKHQNHAFHTRCVRAAFVQPSRAVAILRTLRVERV